jgi:hypothetical protein
VLPAGAEWVQPFIDETASFPAGARDDQVDALSQVLNFLSGAGQSGFIGMMQLEKARASVAAGEPVEDAAKQAGVAEGKLDAWIERSAAAPSRMSAMSSRPPRGHEEAWEHGRKLLDGGMSVEAAARQASALHRVEVPVEGLRAYWQRSNAPTGPSRPRFAPAGSVSPL